MESLKGITQFNTGSMIANGMKLSESAVNSYRASIDGLTLSQAQVALSSTALNNIQKEQILTSAGLLKSTEAVTLEEIKQMAASASLSAQKKEEILTTLQGAYSENQWNIEKLEAIVASGGEAGAIAQSILAKKAENAENIKNIAGSKALTASLWGQLKARLALMATNPAVWIAGIVGAGLGLIALENKFSKSLDECTEELDKLNSEFEQSQSEAESLESEWENCKTRLDELQKLADNGTISIIEQEEYERLQKTNDELERNLRIEKEKSQLSAIKGATTADETLTKRVQSQYIRGSVESYEGVVLEDQILSVFPEEELDAAIEEYQRLQTEIDNLNKAYDNGEISTSDYEKKLGSLTDQQTKARNRASEMSDILVDCEQAYTNLDNTGGSFTTTQKNNYNAVTEANKRYNDFLGTINDVNETFENLDTTEKARTLKDRYAKKTLSLPNGQGTYTVDDKEISDWIDTLSDEDLKILGTINFSGEQTKDSMQEALDYAKIHTNANPDEITVSSLSEYLNQDNDDIAKIKEDLLELARSGEITEDTFNSTKEYRAILSELGITSEEASRQLMQMTDLEMDLSDWQTQISNARSSISELQDFVKEINKEGLSSSSVDKIVTDYPQLLKHLGDTPTLLTEINKLIEEQSINAQNAGNMLVEYNASAYEQIKSTAQSAFDQIEILQNGQIKSLADMYGIDLDNYSSLAQAKKEIEFALLGSLNEGWASHFGIVIDSLTGFATATENLGEYYNNKENQEKVAQYNQLISKLNKAKEQFEGKVNYGDVGTSSSSSDKDTTETIDWIERAVEKVESEISQLDKVVDSVFSTVEAKNKALVDQIGLINKEIELQQQAYESYMQKAESVGLSDEYKNLVQNGSINIEDITDEDLQKIKLYQDYYDKAQDTLEKINDLHEEPKQKHVDGYELEADELKRKLDTQSITEKQYIDDMLVLWERYYENQVEYAEVAKNKKLDILAEEKSYLEKVASAATGILDYEIDKLEEQKENAVKGYKAEIEVYEEKIDAVEAQIEVIEEQVDVIEEKRDALQDTLDNLEKQRTKEQEILNLQKAQYELERAKTQRTKLQYQDGQIKYVTDDSAIKTARDNVDDAEFAITKRGIQDQIDNYDSQIDGLNKQVDGLNKVIDGYNKQIDKLNVLIDKSDAYYDGEIANLEKIKNEWTKALEIEQRAIDIRNFTDQFGEGAISRLISGDMSLVNEWKQSYLDTLEEIDLTSQGKVGAITEKFAELAGVDLTNAANQAKGVTSEIEALTDSVNDASTAIAGASSGNGEEPSKSKGEQSTSANSLVEAIDASYTTASEKLPAETEMMDGFTEATMSATEMMNGLTESTILATGEVDKLGEAINALPNEKTITIKIETQGSIPSVGGSSISSSSTKTSKVDGRPAHAEGTAKVTGDWGVRQGGKTLVGELGQEIVVRNGRFFTVGDNGAEFVDLQKGDIVFNHLQSKELLSKGNIVGRGNALAEGTIQKATTPSYLRPIQEGDKNYELIKAMEVYQDMIKTNIMLPVNSIDKNVEMMARNISNVSTNNVNKPTLTINGGINVSCPGVNSQEIMNQVKTAMHREIGGIALEALQEASITR